MSKDKRLETAILGVEAENFLNSPVGRYLVDRANAEANLAIEEMKSVDSYDQVAVRKIQSKLVIPDNIVSWLAGVIAEGAACEYQIRTEDELEGE